jgi:hypothetical protein
LILVAQTGHTNERSAIDQVVCGGEIFVFYCGSTILERERERETDRQTDREKLKGTRTHTVPHTPSTTPHAQHTNSNKEKVYFPLLILHTRLDTIHALS